LRLAAVLIRTMMIVFGISFTRKNRLKLMNYIVNSAPVNNMG
jgi:hypothetical protein